MSEWKECKLGSLLAEIGELPEQCFPHGAPAAPVDAKD